MRAATIGATQFLPAQLAPKLAKALPRPARQATRIAPCTRPRWSRRLIAVHSGAQQEQEVALTEAAPRAAPPAALQGDSKKEGPSTDASLIFQRLKKVRGCDGGCEKGAVKAHSGGVREDRGWDVGLNSVLLLACHPTSPLPLAFFLPFFP